MKNFTLETIKIYLSHAKKYKAIIFLLYFSVVVATILNTLVPIFYKILFDELSTLEPVVGSLSILFKILIMIAGVEVLSWIFWRTAGLANNYFQPRVMADLVNTCFRYLHKHSFGFFNNNFVGSLVKRVNRFAHSFEIVADNFTWYLTGLVVNITVILGVLFYRKFELGLVVLIWITFFFLFNIILIKYKLKYDIKRTEAETEASGFLADTISNHENVKLFSAYKREVKNFSGLIENVRKLRKFTWDLDLIFEAFQTFLMIVLEVVMMYFAIIFWQKGILTIGDFVLINAYVLTIFRQVWNFGRTLRSIFQNLADAEDMTRDLIVPHEINDQPKAKTIKVKTGKIKFKDVYFNYRDTREVLSELNLRIPPGQKIALVGPSGAGKTTIIRLLLRQYDITKGKILIDGQDIQKVKMESLWDNVALVSQDPVLFHRPLIENIRYGKPSSSNKQVMRAAKLAHCHEFINDFPEKYNTYVGERGVKLSGGERQRVAIARAILKNAPILVLDEATSSLDSESEMYIQDALDHLMKDKTVIVIAHRLSTIMKMDRIVVVDKGKVVEDGSHSELIAKKKGIYKKLWDLQAGGFISE